MADESSYDEDVAPDIDQTAGSPKPPVWQRSAAIRANAAIIPSPFNTATGNRNLAIYDLIEFGPVGTVVNGDRRFGGAMNGDPFPIARCGNNLLKPHLREVLYDEPDYGGIEGFPSNCGGHWIEMPEFLGGGVEGKNKEIHDVFLKFQSKDILQLILADFVGYCGWQWQIRGGTIDGDNVSDFPGYQGLSVEEALNNTDTHHKPEWSAVGHVDETIAFNYYNFVGNPPSTFDWKESEGRGDRKVTLADLPFQGMYFKMGVQEFLRTIGISIEALTQGGMANKNFFLWGAASEEFVLKSAAVKALDGSSTVGTWGAATPTSAQIATRLAARKKWCFVDKYLVGAKDILAYNYFYINEDKTQKVFTPAKKLADLRQAIDDADTKEEKEKAKKAYNAEIKRQKAKCINVGNTEPLGVNTTDVEDVIFSEKCILASNMKNLAEMNQTRYQRTKKYNYIELAHGSPSSFINKLFLQKGFLEFAHDSTNIQLSSLIPVYRFYKVKYNDAGCPDEEIEIPFDQQTDIQSLLESRGRGQVGIKKYFVELH